MKTNLMMISAFLFLGACGTIQTHSKDDAAVGRVKKTAVVAFSVNEPASAGIGLTNGKLTANKGGSMIPENDENVDAMLADLNKSIAQNLKWRVMDRKQMTANSGYKKAFDQTMKGWQNKMAPNPGMKQVIVKDVMDFDSPRILDQAGRDALIEALGVDAIIVARVDVNLNGTTVMGIGSRHPQSVLSFNVYRKGDPKPIWFEGSIKGDESEESVGKTSFIDEALLSKLALKSAQTAYAKIGASSAE